MEAQSIITSEDTKDIYRALLKFQGLLCNVPRDKENPHTHSRYATLEALNDWVRPHLQAAGLIIIQPPHSTGDLQAFTVDTRVKQEGKAEKEVRSGLTASVSVSSRLAHADSGQYIQVTNTFIPEPTAGMTLTHAAGAGITYYRRQQMMGLLCIVGDDDLDGNDMTHPPGQQPPPPPNNKPAGKRGMPAGAQAEPSKPEAPKEPSRPAAPEKPAEQPAAPRKADQKPEQPAVKPAEDAELMAARAEFKKAVKDWKPKGIGRDAIVSRAGRLYLAGATSTDASDNYTATDYWTLMWAIDFQVAQDGEYKEKGLTADGLTEIVRTLHESEELSSADVDKFAVADYNKLMDAIDATLGIARTPA